jgi:flagellar assembly factor FliW
MMLKGRVLGFEEFEQYELKEIGSPDSPFRLLSSTQTELLFLVINPFSLVDDYSFDLEDGFIEGLRLGKGNTDDIAILCIVRPGDEAFHVNLRSPLVINTREGLFSQVVLTDEAYGTAIPFAVGR